MPLNFSKLAVSSFETDRVFILFETRICAENGVAHFHAYSRTARLAEGWNVWSGKHLKDPHPPDKEKQFPKFSFDVISGIVGRQLVILKVALFLICQMPRMTLEEIRN